MMTVTERASTVRQLVCAVSLVAGLLAGCIIPFSTGLENTIGPAGVSDTTLLVLDEKPGRLQLSGTYSINQGSLTVQVTAPDGTIAFDRTFEAVSSGSIDEELEPAAGEWSLTVASPGGSGSYEVRLRVPG